MLQKIYLYYLLFINVITFIIFGVDKFLALKSLKRISEKRLHTLSLLGGFIGAFLGMAFFRHKVSKKEFYLKELLITLMWILWLIYYFLDLNRLNFLDVG